MSRRAFDYDRGYKKAVGEMSEIIHSKDDCDFIDGDDYADIVFQLCEYFKIEHIKSPKKIEKFFQSTSTVCGRLRG